MGAVLAGISAGIGIVSGGAKLLGSFFGAGARQDRLKKDLAAQKSTLLSHKKYIKDTYDLNVRDLNYNFDTNRNNVNNQMGLTRQSQLINANLNAIGNSFANKQGAKQLQYAIEETRNQIGASIQNMSTSGYKRSEGTTSSRMMQRDMEEADETIDIQKQSFLLSSANNYMQARMNYINSDIAMEQYRQNLRDITESYYINKQKMDNQFLYQDAQLDDSLAQIKNMQDEVNSPWYYWKTIFTDDGMYNSLNQIASSSVDLADAIKNK